MAGEAMEDMALASRDEDDDPVGHRTRGAAPGLAGSTDTVAERSQRARMADYVCGIASRK